MPPASKFAGRGMRLNGRERCQNGRERCENGRERCQNGRERCQNDRERCQNGWERCQNGRERCEKDRERCQNDRERCENGRERCQNGRAIRIRSANRAKRRERRISPGRSGEPPEQKRRIRPGRRSFSRLERAKTAVRWRRVWRILGTPVPTGMSLRSGGAGRCRPAWHGFSGRRLI